MRRLLFSMGIMVVIGPLARAQTPPGSHDGASLPQIPFGQTYKDFQFPIYQKGQLAYTLTAVSAVGVTLNRADATDVKIDAYTDNKVTTTITSPRADLYIAERKMRSKNTVKIERADLEATSQICDFDLAGRKFLLRQNVRVLLKDFDVGTSTKANPTAPRSLAVPMVPQQLETDRPITPAPTPPSAHNGDSLIDLPGASAGPNTGPLPPPPPSTP